MSENLVIEAPEFEEIEKKAGAATRNAINLLWTVLNEEIKLRRKTVRDAKETLEVKVKTDLLAANQDNYDTERATIIYFTGAAAFNLTGLRNGVEGAFKILHNTGAGTITIKNSVTSDAANQFVTSTGADKALTTNQSIAFAYLNSRWREYKPL